MLYPVSSYKRKPGHVWSKDVGKDLKKIWPPHNNKNELLWSDCFTKEGVNQEPDVEENACAYTQS